MLDYPRISVIMPTLNAGQYIADAIDSVIRQTWESWELLVMDGLSTDATEDIVRSYDSHRIRFCQQADEGVTQAWDRAIDLARGDYVLFLCSSDAYLDDGWLESCVQAMDVDPELSLVWGLPAVVDPTDGSIQPHGLHPDEIERSQKRQWLLLWLATGRTFPDPTMCVSRQVLGQCMPRYRIGSRVMDALYAFFFEFNRRGYLAYGISRPVTFCRPHAGQLSVTGPWQEQRRWILIDYSRRIRRYRRALLTGQTVHVFRDRSDAALDELTALSGVPEHHFYVRTRSGERKDMLAGANLADDVSVADRPDIEK